MDNQTRNLLKRMTQDARSLLEGEFSRQLEGLFDILPNGFVAETPGEHLSPPDMFLRGQLVAAILHRRARGETEVESVAGFLRESAFTAINRFVALKMLEARGLTRPCVSKGEESAGFKEFSLLAPGLASLPDKGYRLYLESIFDEIGREVGVLFDRRDPAARLWPTRPALLDLISLLNEPELDSVWGSDETIGWVYQYFNRDDERREMRQSQAPQNSREMAVRNQFFTPRYVVEFLTDNTLGRLWYEMRRGDTALKEKCRYLMRRRRPVFLELGEDPPAPFTPTQNWTSLETEMWVRPNAALEDLSAIWEYALSAGGYEYTKTAWDIECDTLANERLARYGETKKWSGSFEELRCCLFFEQRRWRHFGYDPDGEDLAAIKDLYNAICERWDLENEFIPHRVGKDPRELRILDPACGSGHFLLYCFDLLEVIYAEAWQAEIGNLRTLYPSFDALRREIPKLILHHNLHGIDIDPRAAQIGSLALWMRAQRSWQDTARDQRPEVRKTNIAIAEPMPGEADLLDEFCASLNPNLLGQLVREVFDKMKLAGDAGALLRIEADIADAAAEARRQAVAEESPTDRAGNPLLFASSTQRTIYEVQGVPEDFWPVAEAKVVDALHRYVQHATNGHTIFRRLFAEDAERGFAFIDLCRKRYDVILMNPPFGEACAPSQVYIDENYGDTKGDVYKAFVEGSWDRLSPGGMLGIISSRTGFFLDQSQDWRERVVLRLYRPLALADLGDSVLDAMVETAAYVLRRIGEREERDLTFSLVPELQALQAESDKPFSIPKYARQRNGLKRHQALQELSWLMREGLVREVAGHFKRYEIVRDALVGVVVPPPVEYPLLTCVRCLYVENKPACLEEAARNLLDSSETLSSVFTVSPASFGLVPGSPFAYWVDDSVRHLFQTFPPFESDGRTAKVGLQTSDDFRFVRAWWEVPETALLTGNPETGPEQFRRMTYDGKHWVPFAKGGKYSPYYADVYLVVNWARDGGEMKAWAGSLYNNSHWTRIVKNVDHYFRPGLTWPSRTNGLSVRALPKGCAFAHKGPSMFVESDSLRELNGLSSIVNSSVFTTCVSMLVARETLAQSFEVGLIQRVPVPKGSSSDAILERSGAASLDRLRALDRPVELSHVFQLPALLSVPGDTLAARASVWESHLASERTAHDRMQLEINSRVAVLYGVPIPPSKAISVPSIEAEEQDAGDQVVTPTPGVSSLVAGLISYAVGCAFGRWNPEFATRARSFATLLGPFAPLPSHAPSAEGANIAGPDVLVDDSSHAEDLSGAIEGWFLNVFGAAGSRMFQEGSQMLAGPDRALREWLAGEFFSYHLARYSKKPRKAPIYWQLSIPSKRWSVWLYYHRLTKDTFWRILNDFVKPKLEGEERRLAAMRAEGREAPDVAQRRVMDEQQQLVDELASFREEVERIAPLWAPNINDGVLLNFAPLWRLVPQVPSWQQQLREAWESLCAGKYDWAHLALHLWPERVIPKCARDRSLAMAHACESTFWAEGEDGKWEAKKVPAAEVKRLIQERTSPAVKDALERLTNTPTVSEGPRRRRAARSNR